MPPAESHLVVVGCNHQRTPLEVRERIAIPSEQRQALAAHINALPSVRESTLLHTCNRIEVYAHVSNPADFAQLHALICQHNGCPPDEWQRYAYTLTAEAAITHAFTVAAGLDSELVGETEILGQMKDAYQLACKSGKVGARLHRLFQKAFQAAKWARTHTTIGQGQVSLGNVAVDLAQRIFGRLIVSRTLVIGAGDVGRDVAKAFRSRGVACLSVANRTAESAQALAAQVDGLVIPFSNWQDHLPYSDIVILATSAPQPILAVHAIEAALAKRNNRPLFLIDLAVPRDVEPAAADLANIFLYNFHDLSTIANENLQARIAEVESCRATLALKASRLARSMA